MHHVHDFRYYSGKGLINITQTKKKNETDCEAISHNSLSYL